MSNTIIDILLVDDHHIFRDGLKRILLEVQNLNVVGEACNGVEALKKIDEYRPNIIVMDINMPIKNGLDVVKEIKENGKSCKVIILTASKKMEFYVEATKLGVEGYLIKECSANNLIEAIEEVSKGKMYKSKQVNMIHNDSTGDDYDSNYRKVELLSPREYEVLSLIAEGLSNKDIGRKLFISEKTVKNHITQIFKKLEVNDRVQAALFTYKHIKKWRV